MTQTAEQSTAAAAVPAAVEGGLGGVVTDEPPLEVDVAIFGAGPAGLTTALAICKACPDLKVHVFERAKKLRPSGGSIALFSKNTFWALGAIGEHVQIAVKEAGIERRAMITGDKEGENRKTGAVPSTIIAWYELQKALLSCLPTENMVTLNCELLEVEEEGGWAVARMRGGGEVRARVVVGADGNRSAARKYVQGGSEPQYVGAAVWRFFCPGTNPYVEPGDSLVLTGDNKTMVLQPVRRNGEVLTYCAGISGFDEERLPELNQTRYIQASEEGTQSHRAKLARFAEALQAFNPEMVEYAMEHAVPESVLEHPMYSLNPRAAWVRGAVALVGDAVHVMPPNLGQGTPMAIEDAVQLAASLKMHACHASENGASIPPEGDYAAALVHYEAERKPRVTPIWDESHRQAMSYYRQRVDEDDPMNVRNPKGANVFEMIMSYTAPLLAELEESS